LLPNEYHDILHLNVKEGITNNAEIATTVNPTYKGLMGTGDGDLSPMSAIADGSGARAINTETRFFILGFYFILNSFLTKIPGYLCLDISKHSVAHNQTLSVISGVY
jgi:hypothetical protein